MDDGDRLGTTYDDVASLTWKSEMVPLLKVLRYLESGVILYVLWLKSNKNNYIGYF